MIFVFVFSNTRTLAAKEKQKAIVFGDTKDAAIQNHLAEILHRQEIKFHGAGDWSGNKYHRFKGQRCRHPKTGDPNEG